MLNEELESSAFGKYSCVDDSMQNSTILHRQDYISRSPLVYCFPSGSAVKRPIAASFQ